MVAFTGADKLNEKDEPGRSRASLALEARTSQNACSRTASEAAVEKADIRE